MFFPKKSYCNNTCDIVYNTSLKSLQIQCYEYLIALMRCIQYYVLKEEACNLKIQNFFINFFVTSTFSVDFDFFPI